jgi:hypothetical protein
MVSASKRIRANYSPSKRAKRIVHEAIRIERVRREPKSGNGLDKDATEVWVDLKLPAGETTPTQILLPDYLSLSLWIQTVKKLGTIQSGVQWYLGDLWIFGERKYGQRQIKAAIQLTSLHYTIGTLMNFGWVAGRIPASFRNENLSYTHHVVVAPLPPDEQQRWLERAATKKLSVEKLRKAIKERPLPPPKSAAEHLQALAEKLVHAAEQAYQGGVQNRCSDAVFERLDASDINALLETTEQAADEWKSIHEQVKLFYKPRTARK